MENRKAADGKLTKRVGIQILRWRWWIVGFLAFVSIFIQLLEDLESTTINPLFYIELLVFIVLLGLIGFLFLQFQDALSEKERAVNLLNTRHSLSLELSAAHYLEEVSELIIKFLQATVKINHASLEISNQETQQVETLIERYFDGESTQFPFSSNSAEVCEKCIFTTPGALCSLQTCPRLDVHPFHSSEKAYCLPIFYSNRFVAVLHFSLSDGASITPEQVDILVNAGEEIAFALENHKQRRYLSEMRANKAVMEERLSIFRDLHDTLAQTLAYINLKLSQLAHQEVSSEDRLMSAELDRLSKIANEAYDQIRETLKILRTESSGELTSLLIDRSDMVAERSKINVEVSTIGTQRLMPDQITRRILYAFREALNNVEKHAQAEHVNVQINWGEEELVVRIADDGQGFIPAEVQKERHFGLTIMKERMVSINGQMLLNSELGKGTEVILCIPYSTEQNED